MSAWANTVIHFWLTSSWLPTIIIHTEIPITAFDDKCEITAIKGTSHTGQLLPPQLLCGGCTTMCHLSFNFSPKWGVWQWKALIVFLNSQGSTIAFWTESYLMWNVFRAPTTLAVLQKLSDGNFLTLFVPANCTNNLQPMGLVGQQTFEGCNEKRIKSVVCSISVDLRMSVIQPLSSERFLAAFDHVKHYSSCLRLVRNVGRWILWLYS